MAKVRKANVILQIKDTEVDKYIDLGYNLIDDNGNILRRCVPTTIVELRMAYDEHIKKIAELEAEIAELKKSASTKRGKKSDTVEE